MSILVYLLLLWFFTVPTLIITAIVGPIVLLVQFVSGLLSIIAKIANWGL